MITFTQGVSMSTRNAIVAALLLALPLAGCAGGGAEPAGAPSAAPRAKRAAPVSIEAKLGSGTARLVFRFAAPSEGVDISVNGIDGLTVTSATALVQNGTFERGATAAYDVAYTPGPGRSMLNVTITGIFGGARSGRAAAFTVGEPTAAQKAAAEQGAVDASDEVKVLDGTPRR